MVCGAAAGEMDSPAQHLQSRLATIKTCAVVVVGVWLAVGKLQASICNNNSTYAEKYKNVDRSALRTKDREGAGPNGGRAGGRAGGSADHTLPHYIKSVMKTAARIDRQTDRQILWEVKKNK